MNTREDTVLDKYFTNSGRFYNAPTQLSRLGKSYHNSVLITSNQCSSYDKGKTEKY